MARIAISYRREDTGWITGRIFDRLKAHYEPAEKRTRDDHSAVFMDYDSTPIGVDFRDHIRATLDNCDILLVVIGPHWIGRDSSGAPRITRKTDWVRTEIEIALKNRIPIVPVLIDRTPLPEPETLPEEIRDLVFRQAAIVDTQIDFNWHLERLIRKIDERLSPKSANSRKQALESVESSDLERSRSADPHSPEESSQRNPGNGTFWRAEWAYRLAPAFRYKLMLSAAISIGGLIAIGWFYLGKGQAVPDPVYETYTSREIGITTVFPINILSLDTTERNQRKLIFRSANGDPLIKILRTTPRPTKDVRIARQNEIDDLKRMDFFLTYIAPEREENWSNWYVLSGVKHGTVFYFRRWLADDSVVSIEFVYPKEQAVIFNKVIPRMTRDLAFSASMPKGEF